MNPEKEKELVDELINSMKDIGQDLNDLMLKHNKTGEFELIVLLEMGKICFEKNLNHFKSFGSTSQFSIEEVTDIQRFIHDIMGRDEAMKKVNAKEYENERNN